MWRLKALPRRNLPLLVFLKRLAAPRWVFSFGMMSFFRSTAAAAAPLEPSVLPVVPCRRPRLAAQNRVHLVAFKSRHRFRDGNLSQFLDEPFEDATANL